MDSPINGTLPVIHPKSRPTRSGAKIFQFIVNPSPGQKNPKTAKLIKSHVSRTRDRRKKHPDMKSWIQRQDGSLVNAPLVEHKIPERVGSDFSLLDFPEALQAYMREDLTHCMF